MDQENSVKWLGLDLNADEGVEKMTNEAGLEFENQKGNAVGEMINQTIRGENAEDYAKAPEDVWLFEPHNLRGEPYNNGLLGYLPAPGSVRYIRADLAIPEGYALVPIEPTYRMLDEGISYWNKKAFPFNSSVFLYRAYKAMIAAAQKGESK